jgi:16S rRNA (guanine527-N7)-methyltransferase
MKREDLVLEQIARGLEPLNLAHLSEAYLNYLLLLTKWNTSYNLTAIRNTELMVSKHLLDSLAILPWVDKERILDVGTGPGLPGIPLAIAQPEKTFFLLDSNGKKVRFLREAKRVLALENIEIVPFRAEHYRPEQGFDTVVSRAFSSLEQMIYWTQHLLKPNGIWLAMKGLYPEEELSVLQKNYQVMRYAVPGINGKRCCVLIDNKNKE